MCAVQRLMSAAQTNFIGGVREFKIFWQKITLTSKSPERKKKALFCNDKDSGNVLLTLRDK